MKDLQAKQPKFSIITTCYNLSKLIERAIESVESQTFKNYEFIINLIV